MKPEFDVAVIGLGPAGTLSSLFLDDSSIKVLCIDKDTEIYNLPRAVTIDDEGLRMLQRLNLERIYLDNGTQVEGAYFLDNNLKEISGIKMPEGLITKNGWMPSLMFHQPFTDSLLRKKLLSTDCSIQLGTELIDIIPRDNYYEIKTLDVKREKKNSYTTKYVLGADGASSKVRKIMQIEHEDLDYDKNWLVVDVELNIKNKLPNYAAQICDPTRICTYIPAHLPFRRWEFILLEGETKEEILKQEKIQELISPWLKASDYKIVRATVYRFHSLLAKHFKKDNCFVMGDAAHQNPPFMGQGMMSGYRDALNLSWKLTGVIKKYFPESVLDTYESERKPHSRFVVEGSASIGKLITAYAEGVQNGDISSVPKELVEKGYGSYSIPPLKEGIFFNGSSDKDSMAGFLFPQPLLMEGLKCKKRLDNLLGKNFCVVSKKIVELELHQKKFYEKIKAEFVILDKDILELNPLIKDMMVKNDIYILRPDRHIFGSTSDKISFYDLTKDLQKRLSI